MTDAVHTLRPTTATVSPNYYDCYSYYWSYYFGYRTDGYYGSASHDENGWVTLGTGGAWSQRYTLPEADFPAPRTVTLTTEVTDSRDQTLSDSELNYMHRQLLDLKVYSGYDDFEDGDRLKRRLEGKHHKKHHQLQHQQGARKHQKSFSNKFGESRARAAAGNGMKYSRVSWFYS